MKRTFDLPRALIATGLALTLAGLALAAIASAQPVPVGGASKASQQRAVTEALARYRQSPACAR